MTLRVALLVEGLAEYHSLSLVATPLGRATGNDFGRIGRVPVDPKAQCPIIARAARPYAQQLLDRGADLVVLLLDLEDQSVCPGERAACIQAALSRMVTGPVQVVLKNRSYENWLLADIAALGKHPKRFGVTRSLRRAVEPNKADQCDALALIKRATIGGYDKVHDSRRIMSGATVESMAQHSRSFRRLLRVVGHPSYRLQSRDPAPAARMRR